MEIVYNKHKKIPLISNQKRLLMIYDFTQRLKQEILIESDLLRKYNGCLASLKKYKGQKLLIHNKPSNTFFSSYQDVQKKDMKYLGKQEHPAVQAIQQRYYLEHVIANLKNNIAAMDKLAARYKTIEPNRLREQFPKAYQFNAPEIFELAVTIDEKKWKEAIPDIDYSVSKSHPEHLTQIAADGHYPYINLITTFDDADGNIDSRLIEKLVKEFFL